MKGCAKSDIEIVLDDIIGNEKLIPDVKIRIINYDS